MSKFKERNNPMVTLSIKELILCMLVISRHHTTFDGLPGMDIENAKFLINVFLWIVKTVLKPFIVELCFFN